MKLVVQRVAKATVSLAGNATGSIGKGLFVLIGIGKSDSKKQADKLVDKLAALRIMSDKEGKMNLTVDQSEGSFLIVSQFTLYASTAKGNRPSFVDAAELKKAVRLYNYFIDQMKKKGMTVATGNFGEYMNIDLDLDGPVTITLED
jgi:D-aminoacyl-tRNA deacylase